MPISLRRGSGVWLVAAVLLLSLLLVIGLLGWTVEWLWMRERGYVEVFWRIRLTQVGLFLAALVPVFLYFWANARAVRRAVAGGQAAGGGPWTPRMAAGQMPDWVAGTAAVVVPFLGAVVVAMIVAGTWDDFLRLRFAQPFGRSEPVLGREAGFYVFTLPFLEDCQSILVGVSVIGLGVHLLAYHQYDLLRAWKTLDERVRRRLLRNLAANAAPFFLAWGGGYYLDRFHLLHESGGTVFGPGYTDVTVVLPVLAVMAGASVALVAVILAGAARNRMQWPLLGIGSYALIAAVVLLALPALFQQFVVKPNELEMEAPYLRHNIAFTRLGFGLERVEERSYPAVTELTYDEALANTDTLDNIRLWDWRPLHQTYRQMQEIRLYYEFYNIDVDRYAIDGRLRQVLLAARELGDRLPGQSNTWVNRILQYTHGYGLAMSLAAHEDAAGEGLPKLVVKDLPPAASGGLRVDRPAIYFGEAMGGYRVVNTGIEEFDYPRGDDNVYARYQGTGGVPLSSWWRRLLFAWNRFDVNILISSYVTPESRILLWRRVAERVAKIAPFLALDADPYLVLSDGRLYWIQDAYTVARTFPYSDSRDTGVNYIRNSVKVVIDAYEGSVDFYVADEADPVLRAYRAAFPGLFKPLSAITPDLKAHLRYPQDLFSMQVRKYRRYHMQNPQVFYNNEDLWALANEKYGGKLGPMLPYYILMRLPGEAQLQFLLMIPLTPYDKDNMIAWMAARADFPGYGDLVVYKFPKERLIYGPLQIEALIDQDTVIARQRSLWDQRGSRVIRGNIMVIPVNHAVLYVEPVYLIAETSDVPQLKRVIVAYNGRVAMEPSLDEALAAVFGARRSDRAAEAADTGEPEEMDRASPGGDALERAREAVQRADAAMKRGDWRAFGAAMDEVRRALGEE